VTALLIGIAVVVAIVFAAQWWEMWRLNRPQ